MKLFGFGNDQQDDRLTPLTNSDLNEIQSAIKYIASIGDKEEAFLAIDRLIYQITTQINPYNEFSSIDEDQYFEEKRKQSIEEMKHIILRIQKLPTDLENEEYERYEFGNVKYDIDNIDENWSTQLKENLSKSLTEFRTEANELLNKVETNYFLSLPQKTLNRTIHSTASVQSILTALQDSEKYLKKQKIYTKELKAIVLNSKTRLAWFRANKNIKLAEVAKGGGSLKKVERLLGEAEIMLKQDWQQIFKEKVPEDELEKINR